MMHMGLCCAGDLLDAIISENMEIGDPSEVGSENTPGVMSQLVSTVTSIQRFLKSIST